MRKKLIQQDQKEDHLRLDLNLYQLLKHQDTDSINSKPFGNALETLDLYGIKNLYICANSMKERNLSAEDLVISAKLLSNGELKTILSDSNTVFNL